MKPIIGVPEYIQIGQCHLYCFGHIQIENLFNELKKRRLALKHQIDIIISRWTLRHLADPLGTFLQAYKLLKPQTGIMLFDEFYFLINQQIDNWYSHQSLLSMLIDTKIPFLMYRQSENHEPNHFIIQKTSNLPLKLQWHYQGIELVPVSFDIASLTLTRFNLLPIETKLIKDQPFMQVTGDVNLYCELKQKNCFNQAIGFFKTISEQGEAFQNHLLQHK